MIKPSLVKRFQSTHPLRGATFLRIRSASMPAISIHAPLAGCDSLHKVFYHTKATISIHAPLAGCDRSISSHRLSILINFNPRTPCGVRRQCNSDRRKSQQFQSTHPLRGATMEHGRAESGELLISIHAPLAGCDGKHISDNLQTR